MTARGLPCLTSSVAAPSLLPAAARPRRGQPLSFDGLWHNAASRGLVYQA